MSDLLKEFQDDMRREKSEQFWKNVGKNMVGVSVAIVIGTIGGVVWKEYKASNSAAQTDALMNAFERMEAQDYKGAVNAFADAANQSSGAVYGIATLSKAYALQKNGDVEGAQDAYKALANDSNSDGAAFASIARILASRDTKEVIEPVKGSPFYHAQMEWKAWQLLDADKKDEAVNIFAALNDDKDTPKGVLGRAAEALQLLAPEKLLPKSAEVKSDAK
ncbi:MAG: tetratricopeptide repeat protein [Alphaproteobacteria bacterium]